MSKVVEMPVRGDTVEQTGMDAVAPDTQPAALGAMVEEAQVSMAQTERPVDIMKVGGKILGYTEYKRDGEDNKRRFKLNEEMFTRIGNEIAQDTGDIVLVTSAGILAGMQAVGTGERPSPDTEMPELQRLSSVGRRHIENAWAEALQGREIGGLSLTTRELDDVDRHKEALQIVQTLLDSVDRHEEALQIVQTLLDSVDRREEALHVIQALLRHNEVPVVNENDAITHEEITFGSNDILAARLAARMQESDLFGTVRLFLLTDVNGVYGSRHRIVPPAGAPFYSPPIYDRSSERIPIIENTDEYRSLAGEANNDYTIGGMASKFDAADIANAAGVDMWVYNPGYGHRNAAVAGDIGTYFPATR